MIATLTGLLAELSSTQAVIECNGVGYAVTLPTSVLAQLPAIGSQVRLHTSFVVRNEAQSLYGFLHATERDLFNVLMRINGVGPKSALNLLSALDAASLAQAVQNNDAKSIARAPGIGPKGANRILMELRDNPRMLNVPAQNPIHAQAVEALVTLGFPVTKVRVALAGAHEKDMDVAALVKAGLAKLSGEAISS